MKTSASKYHQCLYFTANALARKVDKLASVCWKPVDLTPSHAYLLMLVCEQPGAQPGWVAQQLQLQPSTVTRLIEKLEGQKLVIRTFGGKLTNIYPTPKAKELYPELVDIADRFTKQYTEMLGERESAELAANMALIADRLDA